MRRYALIVAGGKGTRMNADLPKQFMLLKGIPVLMYTLKAFYHYDTEIKIILVLAANEQERWQQLCEKFHFSVPHTLTDGGVSRSESVVKGLSCINDDNGLVAIHDGVRPLVSARVIGQAYNEAEEKGSAIASVPLKDSIRLYTGEQNQAVDRSQYRLIQTPQTFQLRLIREAYQKMGHQSMTDDASVLEAVGHRVSLIEGSYRNLKITTPEDLKIAEALWQE